MFLAGMAALAVLFLLPHFERTIAGLAAVAIVAAVLVGFLSRPRREVFIVRTNYHIRRPDDVFLEHNRLAVRVELARLWLLFIPTFLAVGFLVITAAKGSVWNFPLVDRFENIGAYSVIVVRVLVVIVWAIVSTWVSERWALRGVDSACSAGSVTRNGEYVWYSFIDGRGEYFGGSDFPLGATDAAELATIVLYQEQNPQVNKIALACLFHRLQVLAHGLTDLDEETIATNLRPALAQPPQGG